MTRATTPSAPRLCEKSYSIHISKPAERSPPPSLGKSVPEMTRRKMLSKMKPKRSENAKRGKSVPCENARSK